MGSLAPPTHTPVVIRSGIITQVGAQNLQKPQLPSVFLEITLPARQAFTMADAFCATWKLVDSENFDEYMKALGE